MTEQQELGYAERMEVFRLSRMPLSVMNAASVGVPLDRELVRRRLQGGMATAKDGLGVSPVMWEARRSATRHLLAAGPRASLEALRDVLFSHARASGGLWKAAELETKEEQLRVLSLGISDRNTSMGAPRLMVVVWEPGSQEVLSLLTEFVREADVTSRVSFAVLTSTPAAIPSALLRDLGFRVCFRTNHSDSRDVVGDGSAATLPWARYVPHAAVVYEEWFSNDPKHEARRVDLPGRLYGRRRDVYVTVPPATETGAAADADAVPPEGGG